MSSLAAFLIVELFVESALYGLYLSTFIFCLRALLLSKSTSTFKPLRQINYLMLAVALALFIVGTLNLLLGLMRNLHLFAFPMQTDTKDKWIDIVKPISVNIQTLLADGVLTYRCWIVYGKSVLVALFPAFLWAMTVVLVSLNIIATQEYLHTGVRTERAYILGLTTLAMTITLNIYATSVIALRIWLVNRQTKRISTTSVSQLTPLRTIMRIVIESGLMYTLASICSLAASIAKSNVVFPISAVMSMTVGIAFNLIIIRIARTKEASETLPALPHPQGPQMTELRFRGMCSRSNPLESQPVNEVAGHF
ncbi:hypothetical protein BDQ17DRAFT_1413101 [Cyathus striatus]|nr:hypothetical protein BDQ17DRAFT_1413101 [Cyathus striatus]